MVQLRHKLSVIFVLSVFLTGCATVNFINDGQTKSENRSQIDLNSQVRIPFISLFKKPYDLDHKCTQNADWHSLKIYHGIGSIALGAITLGFVTSDDIYLTCGPKAASLPTEKGKDKRKDKGRS